MKKSKIFGAFLALFAVVGLAACDDTKDKQDDGTQEVQKELQSISVAGGKASFTVGDTFDKGDLVVTAKYEDGSTENVTSKATITQSANMSKPGSYAVIVSYQGQTAAYQITVTEVENVETLIGIDLNTTNVKTSYIKGDEISYEGLSVNLTYSNSTTTDNTIKVVSDLTDFAFTIENSKEEVVTDIANVDKYTVTVTYVEFSDSYQVKVNYYTPSTFAEALDLGLANEDKINGGEVKLTSATPYGSASSMYDYTFGSDYTSYKDDNYTYYYSIADDEVFCAGYNENNGITLIEDGIIDNLNGYVFVDIAGAYNKYYGVSDLLTSLYALSQEENSHCVETVTPACNECGAKGTYALEFYYCDTEDYYLYEIKVQFSMGFDEIITDLSVYSGCYTMREYNVDTDEYDYLITVDADGNYIIPEDKEISASVQFDVVQSVGDRTLENPYAKDTLLYSSYDLTTDSAGTTTAPEEMTLTVGTLVYFYVKNALPETASYAVDALTCKVTNEFGQELVLADTFYTYFSSYSGAMMVKPLVDGTYNLTISSANVSHTYKITSEYEAPTSITPYYYNGSNYVSATNVEIKAFVGKNTYFYLEMEPTAADPNVSITSSLTTYTITETQYAYNDCYQFVPTAAGTYTLTITSTKDSTISTTITIVAEEFNVASVLNGIYAYDFYGYYWCNLELKPTEIGATSGVATIDYYLYSGGYVECNAVYNYSYSDTNGLQFEYVSGDTNSLVTFAINDFGTITMTYGTSSNVLTYEGLALYEIDTDQVAALLNGTYYAKDTYGYYTKLTFTPAEAGGLSGDATVEMYAYDRISYSTVTYSGVYTYAYDTTNGIVYTYVSGDDCAANASVTVTSDYKLSAYVNATVTPLDVYSVMAEYYDTWGGSITSEGSEVGMISLVLYDDGTGYFSVATDNASSYPDFEFEYEIASDNSVTLTLTATTATPLPLSSNTITIDADGNMKAQVSYDGYECEVTLTPSAY